MRRVESSEVERERKFEDDEEKMDRIERKKRENNAYEKVQDLNFRQKGCTFAGWYRLKCR